jgi:formylmethanofuran dehydrogenase subunit C
MSLELRCTNEEKIPISVNPATASGKPVNLDGPIIVTVTSGDGTVEMIDDRSFFVVSGEVLEPTTFLIEGDADLGAGIVTVADTIILTVEGALAKSLGLSAGPAVIK